MSNKSRLRTDFKVALDHIRDRVVSNVVEAKSLGLYKAEDADVQKVVRIIELAFEQGFITAAVQIEKSIDETVR